MGHMLTFDGGLRKPFTPEERSAIRALMDELELLATMRPIAFDAVARLIHELSFDANAAADENAKTLSAAIAGRKHR